MHCGHCIPSKSSKLQHSDGGRRQQVPDLASVGSSCPLPAQMHLEPTGRKLPAALRVAVAPWLWAWQGSTVLSTWILMPSPQEEVTDLLKSKTSCFLSQWCVKWLRQKQAVLPLMGKQGCCLCCKHQHLLRRVWRDKESFMFSLHCQEAPCGHLPSQLRTPGRRPATMRCLQHTMVLHSPVELISAPWLVQHKLII